MRVRGTKSSLRPVSIAWIDFCRYQAKVGEFPDIFADPATAERRYLEIENECSRRNGIEKPDNHAVFRQFNGAFYVPYQTERGLILAPDIFKRFLNPTFRAKRGFSYIRIPKSVVNPTRGEYRVEPDGYDVSEFIRCIYQYHIEPHFPTKDYSAIFGAERRYPVTDDPEVIFECKGRVLFDFAPNTDRSFKTIPEVIQIFKEQQIGRQV